MPTNKPLPDSKTTTMTESISLKRSYTKVMDEHEENAAKYHCGHTQLVLTAACCAPNPQHFSFGSILAVHVMKFIQALMSSAHMNASAAVDALDIFDD